MKKQRDFRQKWKWLHGDEQVEQAKKTAQEDMGVEFIEVDVQLFKDKVANVQQDMLDANPNIQELYDHIQEVNAKYMDAEAADADAETADMDAEADEKIADMDTETDTEEKEDKK